MYPRIEEGKLYFLWDSYHNVDVVRNYKPEPYNDTFDYDEEFNRLEDYPQCIMIQAYNEIRNLNLNETFFIHREYFKEESFNIINYFENSNIYIIPVVNSKELLTPEDVTFFKKELPKQFPLWYQIKKLGKYIPWEFVDWENGDLFK